jgi:hypothetical protein
LEAEEIFARFVLIAFLNSPCYETPKNAIKKSNQTTEGENKKTDEKKPTFFVMSPDGFFRKKLFRVFELPLLRNSQKTRFKKSMKK